jgi:polygalacturonase
VQTLRPEPKDNSARIQAAIDSASAAGGAVVLAPGTFELEGTVTIAASGVVLRGSGSRRVERRSG